MTRTGPNTPLTEGMRFPSLCCDGYGLTIIGVKLPVFGTMWRCDNPSCARNPCCPGDHNCVYNGVGWVCEDDQERPRTVAELVDYFGGAT